MGQQMRGIDNTELIGMYQIGVITRGDAVQHRMRAVDHQIVPAHLRQLEQRYKSSNPCHLSADPAPGADVLDSAQRLLMADKDHYRQVDELRGRSQSTGKGSVGSSRKARQPICLPQPVFL